MVEVFDIRLNGAAKEPANNGQERLEETKVKGNAKDGTRTRTDLDAGCK